MIIDLAHRKTDRSSSHEANHADQAGHPTEAQACKQKTSSAEARRQEGGRQEARGESQEACSKEEIAIT